MCGVSVLREEWTLLLQPRAPDVGPVQCLPDGGLGGQLQRWRPSLGSGCGPGVGWVRAGAVWGFQEWMGRYIRALTCTLLLLLVSMQLDGGCSMSGPQPAAAPKLGPDKEAGGPAAEVRVWLGTCRLPLSSPGL